MAFSNICNCIGNIIQFTAKCKIFLPFLLLLLTPALAQLDIPTEFQTATWPGANQDLMNRSALKGNLEVVLNSLVENVKKTGYNISSHGENGNKMYGLAQCRGDLNASTCRACISNATKTVFDYSYSSSSASIYLSGCFLRFDNFSFYSELEYINNITSTNSLDPWMASLLSKLVNDAVSSGVGYSAQNWSEIYALAQCWRVLDTSLCRQCLETVSQMLASCSNESEGLGFYQNCMIKYERYKFYGDAGLLSSLQSVPSRVTDQAPMPSSGPSKETDQAPVPSSVPSRAPDEGKKRPSGRPLVVGFGHCRCGQRGIPVRSVRNLEEKSYSPFLQEIFARNKSLAS